jgi:hypothetical protein
VLVLAAVSVAQSQEFEVASVRQSKAHGAAAFTGGPGSPDPGQITIVNTPLRAILMSIYRVKASQIEGPAWLDDVRYDIVAKLPDGITREQANTMLQRLLADRLGLKLHHQTRSSSGYRLIVSKKGFKMQEAAGNMGRPMAQIAFMLETFIHQPIVDVTGLTGRYKYNLDLNGTAGAEGATDPGSDFQQALEVQLGLTLQPAKIPIDILVIDRVNKAPSGN